MTDISLIPQHMVKDLESDLSNKLNYNHITNCITEIPQDIKLELNDGTLTLKAGSKVYIPYGVTDLSSTYPIGSTFINSNYKVFYTQYSGGRFFIGIETQEDISGKITGYTYSGFTVLKLSEDVISTDEDTLTPDIQNDALYYDLSKNLIQWVGATGDTSQIVSFPIALNSLDSTIGYTSINQVFNGFGYIGSTVFALPEVKVLIPNGRNSNGTLNNKEFKVEEVQTFTNTVTGSFVNRILLGDTITWNSNINISYFNGKFSNPPTLAGHWGSYYNIEENQMYFNYDSKWQKASRAICGYITCSSDTKITSFNIDYPFNLNDTVYIAHQSFPSNKYIDLTLGASGTTYTAPADGYIYFSKTQSGTTQQYAVITDATDAIPGELGDGAATDGYGVHILRPIKAGVQFKVRYTLTGPTKYFRFIYAEGVK